MAKTRLIETDDIKKLESMYFRFYREVESKSRGLSDEVKMELREDIQYVGDSDNNWGFFVEDSGNSNAGFILCKRYTNSADSYIKAGDVEIESFIDPKNRGRGLGTLLKKIAIESVAERKDDGAVRVFSSVEENNFVNLAVLKKMKFSKVSGADYEGGAGRNYSVYAKKIR